MSEENGKYLVWEKRQTSEQTAWRIPWRRRQGGLSLIVFALMVGVLVLFLVGGLQGSSRSWTGLAIVSPLAAFFGYLGFAYWYNRTRLVLTAQHLRVEQGPLWWPGSRSLATEEVESFAVRPRRVRANIIQRSGRIYRSFFDVYAVLAEGDSYLLSTMSHFMERERAEEFAQELEQELKRLREGPSS